MHKLVLGRWNAIVADVAPLQTRQLRRFQDSIRRDGIRKVGGPGVLRHDCPVTQTVDAGSNCFVYRLLGRQVAPIQGAVPLKARYRLWVGYVDGNWQVESYDYDLIPAG